MPAFVQLHYYSPWHNQPHGIVANREEERSDEILDLTLVSHTDATKFQTRCIYNGLMPDQCSVPWLSGCLRFVAAPIDLKADTPAHLVLREIKPYLMPIGNHV